MDPRRKTWELAQSDLVAALKFARNIADNWYRVQSLAVVAWHTKQKSEFVKVAKVAIKDAQQMSEPNRAVSCLAWVLFAMENRKDIDIMPTVIKSLEIIGLEPSNVRQADALLLLYEAVYGNLKARQVVFSPLMKAVEGMKSWKQPIMLHDIALILAKDDVELSERVVEMIKKESDRRKARKAIEARNWIGPHKFFPYYTKVVI